MGKPKMLLPWGDETVLGRAIQVFSDVVGAASVVVVSGDSRAAVEDIAHSHGVRSVFNAAYATGEMLGSIKTGLRAMGAQFDGALIGLGDQPQVERETVLAIIAAFSETAGGIVVPSYQGRRGHPWLVGRSLWDEFLRIEQTETAREFLNRHGTEIHYVTLGAPSILSDLDTPEDYAAARP
jgi:molybdenum cofactor cytidylyltransferase